MSTVSASIVTFGIISSQTDNVNILNIGRPTLRCNGKSKQVTFVQLAGFFAYLCLRK